MINQQIKIVEVGPRDGLQNEAAIVPSSTKIEFINRLSKTGLLHIEVSSFVNPKKIPQLADAPSVFNGIARVSGVNYSALVPNEKGAIAAIENQANSISVFSAASEIFCQKNINCSIEESIARFIPVIEIAKQNNMPVRAYLSCVLGCPYEGYISPDKVSHVAELLWRLGCSEISLGDTIGAGTPKQAQEMVRACMNVVPVENLALHFHDTRGQALANILACLELGVSTIDASVAGLGGCPYAYGATGNVSTEDVVYMLHGMGYKTGIELNKLISVGEFIGEKISQRNNSRVGVAGLPKGYSA